MTCYADAVEEADTQLVDAAYCTALMVITLTHARPHFIDKIYTYEYFFHDLCEIFNEMVFLKNF